jgi:hypothetical protein
VAWGPEALDYLDRRRQVKPDGRCPLPELFAALQGRQVELSLRDFHLGLRRLQEGGQVALLPFEGDAAPEPEYALLDGAAVYYYAVRSGGRV